MTPARHIPVALTSKRKVPRGDGTDIHFHDQHQLLYASQGLLSVRTKTGVWLTPGARAVWIPAGTVHQHSALGSLTIHTVGLPPSENWFDFEVATAVSINRLARELIMTLSEVQDPHEPSAKRLRSVLGDQLKRTFERPLEVRTPRDPRLEAVARAINDDPAAVQSLDDAARIVAVSPRTLSRLCQADLGLTFPQWRTQIRLQHAAQLLTEGHTVTDVAYRCGWSTPSTFIDVFRRALGYTPGRQMIPQT